MKPVVILLLLTFLVASSYGQSKKRDKVKRKFRNVESVSKEMPKVFIRGVVYDEDYIPLPGATVTIDGTKKGVNTNADGEYLIENLASGRTRVRISFIGYKTRTVDIILVNGQNEKNIMMPLDNIHLEPILVNSQKREQQIMDVPTAISSVSTNMMKQSNISDLGQLSEFIPGLYFREQGANRPTFSIRGLNSDEISPASQPRVSVYFNNVPINRGHSSSLELYDMARVEVLRGPQNTLFGRGAQAGAIHYVSKMPETRLKGNITAGFGDYGQKEIRGAVNVPIIEDKLFMRVAGIYNYRNGYVENTFGGDLMGKNTTGARFSARFKPAWNHSFGMILNYQKDDTPGIAFMTDSLANTNGDIGIFSGTASHEQGENLGSGKEIYDATLNYKFYLNEHNYWTSITSYRKSDASSRWDGDGTASEAIDMAEYAGATQFYQEIRGNFSQNSRLNGSLGGSFWLENADQTYWFSTNEQHLACLMLLEEPTPVDSYGQPTVIESLPAEYGGTTLPTEHEEENLNEANNMAIEGFIDFSYQLSKKIFVSAGVRAIYDKYKLNNEALFSGGSESVLGALTGNSPNLLFSESDWQEIKKNTLSFTWRGGLKYRFNEYGNVFANYSRGRRPNVLQFTSSGEEEILDAETLDNFELGFKGSFYDRIFINVTGFYQLYKNFQTSTWESDAETGEYDLNFNDAGQATAYGAEADVRIALIEEIDFYANYAWLKTQFDSTDVDGLEQAYADNEFSLAPEHSFTLGLNTRINLTPTIKLFLNPSYSYKSHFFFDDANSPGLEQNAYGLLNINGGLELNEPNIKLTIWGTNVLDEQYVTSAGNTGNLFGLPTFVPGAPRMIGTKLTWNFTKKEERFRKTKKKKNPWS